MNKKYLNPILILTFILAMSWLATLYFYQQVRDRSPVPVPRTPQGTDAPVHTLKEWNALYERLDQFLTRAEAQQARTKEILDRWQSQQEQYQQYLKDYRDYNEVYTQSLEQGRHYEGLVQEQFKKSEELLKRVEELIEEYEE